MVNLLDKSTTNKIGVLLIITLFICQSFANVQSQSQFLENQNNSQQVQTFEYVKKYGKWIFGDTTKEESNCYTIE